MWIPDNKILVPTVSDWPSITEESFAGLGKNTCVIEALAQTTFLQSSAYEILRDNRLSDWSRIQEIPVEKAENIRISCESPLKPAPSYMVGIISGGSSSGTSLLDCRYGAVYFHRNCYDDELENFDYRVELNRLLPDEKDYEAQIRDGSNWMVQDFFEMIKRKFKLMKQPPYNSYEVLEEKAAKDYPSSMDELTDIYMRHSWPHDFQKEDCVKELQHFDLWRFSKD